jgi:hypothetical protein
VAELTSGMKSSPVSANVNVTGPTSNGLNSGSLSPAAL